MLATAAATPAAAQSYNPNYGPWGNVVFPPYAQQDYWRQHCFWYDDPRCAPRVYGKRQYRRAQCGSIDRLCRGEGKARR